MSLEAATYINDLVSTNPVTGDNVSQGDDHLRLLKSTLKTTFPNATKAHYFPTTEAKTADFSVASTDMHKTFLVSTASVAVTATLPSLTTDDKGWECHFIKTNTDTNALFIAPASGTIQSGAISGLSKTRRCIPGVRTTVIWTGSAWIATRAVNEPVGATISFHGSSLPVGYEWPNGQTLSSASTNYPDYYSVMSTGVTPDERGRVIAGKDDMGGSSANRLTNQTGGLDGDTLGATGGAETHTLTGAQLAAHTHTGTTASGGVDHTHSVPQGAGGYAAGPGGATLPTQSAQTTGSASAYLHTHTFTTDSSGSNGAHNNVQPTIIANKLLVVE